MPEKLPSSSHFGGNHKTDHFYPKIRTYPIYSEADIVTKGNEFLHISVTYGFGLKKNKKIFPNSKKIRCGSRITPKMGMSWGHFAYNPKTIKLSIFRPISVTHEQDSMPVKYNAFLMNKLHPNVQCLCAMPMCNAYVQCLCAMPMCNAYVQCLCAMPMCNAYVQWEKAVKSCY